MQQLRRGAISAAATVSLLIAATWSCSDTTSPLRTSSYTSSDSMYGGPTPSTLSLTRAGAVASVSVTLASPLISPGATTQATAVAYDATGQVTTATRIRWRS